MIATHQGLLGAVSWDSTDVGGPRTELCGMLLLRLSLFCSFRHLEGRQENLLFPRKCQFGSNHIFFICPYLSSINVHINQVYGVPSITRNIGFPLQFYMACLQL